MMRRVWPILWLCLSVGCLRIPVDIITPAGNAVRLRGSVLHEVDEVTIYLDAVQRTLERLDKSIASDYWVDVMPPGAVWGTRRFPDGKVVMRRLGGACNHRDNRIRVQWLGGDYGAPAFAHERLHEAGHEHPWDDDSWPEDPEAKRLERIGHRAGAAILRRYRKLKRMRGEAEQQFPTTPPSTPKGRAPLTSA